MKKKIVAFLITVFIGLTLSMPALAKGGSYMYGFYGDAVDAPKAYELSSIYFSADMNIKDQMLSPSDVFVQGDNIYITDAERNCVYILGPDFKVKKILSQFVLNGQPTTINGAQGIFVNKDKEIYIADTKNSRVIKTDINGVILTVYTQPTSVLYPSNKGFSPLKVSVDSANNLYVIVKDIYEGIVFFNTSDLFDGYFGTNRVPITTALLADYFWKSILSPEQIKQMPQYQPVAYSNFYIASNDFVYSCEPKTDRITKQLKRLNPNGVNVLKAEGSNITNAVGKAYGDEGAAFVDICCDFDIWSW